MAAVLTLASGIFIGQMLTWFIIIKSIKNRVEYIERRTEQIFNGPAE